MRDRVILKQSRQRHQTAVTTHETVARHRAIHMPVPLLLLTLMCLLSLSCDEPESDMTDDGRVIVRYWEKWTGFESDAVQAVVDDFNKSQDRIFVDMMQVSQPDQKLILATAGGNPPDVSGLWSFTVSSFAEKGALTPLNRRLAEAGITEDQYIPALWDLCEHRGMVWGLPSTPATVALHWNRRLFKEAGLDPDKPPTSLEELDRMAERLTIVEVKRDGEPVRVRFTELTDPEREAKDFDIIQLGFNPHEPGWWKQMWGYWFGADLWDGDRTIRADAPENIEAFEWIAGYTEKYGVKNMLSFGESFGNFSSPQNPFLDERVAMVIQGVWMYNFIDKFSPHLDWAAAPFPSAYPDTLPNVTIVECDVLVIPTGARHPDEAFEFIQYVNSRGPMEKLCLGQRKFSALINYSDAFVEEHPNPYIEVFIELAKSPNGITTPRTPIWESYEDELIVAADRVYRHIATPADALRYAQNRSARAMERNLRVWDATAEARMKAWAEQ
jgi:multiple sugar transport system substrate-binding protein